MTPKSALHAAADLGNNGFWQSLPLTDQKIRRSGDMTMQPHQTRIRKMRRPRSRRELMNEPRQTYFDPDIRAARIAARRSRQRLHAV